MAARRHLTLEEISAWFDGEVELGEAEHRHLRECPECGAVRDGHSRLRRLARKAVPRAPADEIWATTAAGLGRAPGPAREPAAVTGPVPEPKAPARRRADPEIPAAGPAPLPRQRRLSPRATAVLLAVAGIVAVLLVLPRAPHRPLHPVPAPEAMPPDPVPAPAGPARPVDQSLAAARALRTVQSRMGRIEFDLGKADPNAASEPALREAAAILARYPGARVVIEGHTDSTGGTEWNLRMSRARAEAVVGWLVERGKVDPRRLAAKGFGGLRPVADNATEAGQEANRRVEFSVVGIPGMRSATPVTPAKPKPARPAIDPAPASPPPAGVSPSGETPPSPLARGRARRTWTGARFVLTADEFTTAGPELISAAGNVRVEPVNPGESYVAVVDGFTRTLTGTVTGVVGEVVNPGGHLIIHTRRPGTVNPAPGP